MHRHHLTHALVTLIASLTLAACTTAATPRITTARHLLPLASRPARGYRGRADGATGERAGAADGIAEELVCVFSKLEPCWTFSFKYMKNDPYVSAARRKCLHLYYYFMERELGLVHVQV